MTTTMKDNESNTIKTIEHENEDFKKNDGYVILEYKKMPVMVFDDSSDFFNFVMKLAKNEFSTVKEYLDFYIDLKKAIKSRKIVNFYRKPFRIKIGLKFDKSFFDIFNNN